MKVTTKILENEFWWGGSVANGHKQPYSAESDFTFDLHDGQNQSAPLYLSSKGRYIWAESPMTITFLGGEITAEGEGVVLVEAGSCLKEAYLAAMKAHFPFENKKLPEKFFRTAQYNTWMEMPYEPSQEKVLAYAHSIVDNGYEPGILIIDEGWCSRYGVWEFDGGRFPDPKAMVEELHSLGFTVMLWIVPYFCSYYRDYLKHVSPYWCPPNEEYAPLFLRKESGIRNVSLLLWFDGITAALDMTSKYATDYLHGQLHSLMERYGVDGFKLDGGNIDAYASKCFIANPPPQSAEELNRAWNEFGEAYEYHEYKDTYNRGGKAVIQRIQDRMHSWENNGLATLVPHAIVQGLLGYPYTCPDMIGGGNWIIELQPDFVLDEELFVRMAQCSALFPMMQFSWAPWRKLSAENQKLCLEAAKLHVKFADYIVHCVNETRVSGEPILRSMEYEYPNCGYEKIVDQFMLGDRILVCPCIVKGQTEKRVVLPKGRWRYVDGT